jgi:hypothetical protein
MLLSCWVVLLWTPVRKRRSRVAPGRVWACAVLWARGGLSLLIGRRFSP